MGKNDTLSFHDDLAEDNAYDLSKAKTSVIKIVHDPFKVVSDGDVEVLLDLIQHPENPLNVCKTRWSGMSLLHRAASQGWTDCCAVLIEHGAKLNEKSIWGWYTPLHMALGNGWEDTAKFLVEVGADIHARNKDREDCCDYAIRKGYKHLGQEFRPIMERMETQRLLKQRKMRAEENRLRAEAAMASASEDGSVETSIEAASLIPSSEEASIDSNQSTKKKKGFGGLF